jgi:hypothetical protein
MKTRNFLRTSITIATITALTLSAGKMSAQNATNASKSAQPATTGQAAPVELSYGVPQVVQLVKANVSDDVILTYIRNSGNGYGLDANQIVYLRQQGVSDTVINAMLSQRTQAAQAAPPPNYSAANSAPAATVVAPPAVTYVQTVPSSTVYVIPDTQTYRYYNWYYNPYPYYGGCYWTYPVVSFSFGWGGHWGGYHGGYYRGGGWHHH